MPTRLTLRPISPSSSRGQDPPAKTPNFGGRTLSNSGKVRFPMTHVSPLSRRGCDVSAALASCRGTFITVGIFSGLINLLMLSGSFYMLQVYDRVLNSRSVPTLIGISILLLCCFVLQGVLDMVRMWLMSRIGARVNDALSERVFDALHYGPGSGLQTTHVTQSVRDLDQIKSFLSSLGPAAFLDLPWSPIFMTACFLLHSWLGWLAFGGGAMILGLTAYSEWRGRRAAKAQLSSSAARHTLAEACARNAEIIAAMGMRRSFRQKWVSSDQRSINDWLHATDFSSAIGAFAKVFRMALQSGVLGLGAYLSIKGELSAGSMIAASVMTARALAPIELALAHWKGFVAARQGLLRLRQMFAIILDPAVPRTALPIPSCSVEVRNLAVTVPGRREPALSSISLNLSAGDGLAIVGTSGSGKSTLAKALVGLARPVAGEIRIDGCDLNQWDRDDLGQYIGYLPQDIALLDGTVAQNIARFDMHASSDAIIAAARASNAHDMIIKLEHGYDTVLNDAGYCLSGGQRQRLALARALYGDPFLVVLDEPNSHLDREGDIALNDAIHQVRRRGGIVVMITHRRTAMAALNRMAVLDGGRIAACGPKDQILTELTRTVGPFAEGRRSPVRRMG